MTQIRNAALLLEYAGVAFLIDPTLSEQGTRDGFAGTASSHIRNPTVGPPVPVETLTAADVVILTRTHGDHWDVTALCEGPGGACGLVFAHRGEKTLYIAGDTVWVKPYVRDLQRFSPNVVVLNVGFAHIDDYGPIIMGTINHCLLTRAKLCAFIKEHGIEEGVLVPDGEESMTF